MEVMRTKKKHKIIIEILHVCVCVLLRRTSSAKQISSSLRPPRSGIPLSDIQSTCENKKSSDVGEVGIKPINSATGLKLKVINAYNLG